MRVNVISSRLAASVRPAILHLGVSTGVALVAAVLIFLVWYPGELAAAQGVNRLVLILIGVDVALGPVITLIVFDRRKKYLWVDLMTIAAVQTAALLYGMVTIFEGRPAYIVFNVDRFDVVQAQEIDQTSLERAREAGHSGISWLGPRWVAAKNPSDPVERNELIFSSAAGGPDLPQLPHLFVSLEVDHPQMALHLRPVHDLKSAAEIGGLDWEAMVARAGRPEPELGYLPMRARTKDGAVILDRNNMEILSIWLVPAD